MKKTVSNFYTLFSFSFYDHLSLLLVLNQRLLLTNVLSAIDILATRLLTLILLALLAGLGGLTVGIHLLLLSGELGT